MKTTGMTILLLAVCLAGENGTAADKVWQTDGASVKVTGAEAVLSARSSVDCARLCLQHSHCISWAFDVDNRKCYLHPTVGPSQHGDIGDLLLFTDTAPMCRESDAPNLAVTTMQRTLTSLEGDVINICSNKSYIHAEHVRCQATGQWETTESGQCEKRLWEEEEVTAEQFYTLPMTPAVGWSACVTATPHNDTGFDKNGFHFNLLDNAQSDVILIVLVWMYPSDGVNNTKAKEVMFLDAKKNDSWLSDNRTLVAEPDNPYNFTGKKLGTRIDKHFPFKLGEQFHMRILSTGVYEWSVFVDGSFYANHTVADPVTDIVYFNPVNDLHIAKLDLWCLQ